MRAAPESTKGIASPWRGDRSRASPGRSDQGVPHRPPTSPLPLGGASVSIRRRFDTDAVRNRRAGACHTPRGTLWGRAGRSWPVRLSLVSAALAPSLLEARTRPCSLPVTTTCRPRGSVRRLTPPTPSAAACIYDLRRISGLNIRARVERQTERDALVHRLRVHRRPPGAGHRGTIRRSSRPSPSSGSVLYPPVPWAKGRRPPDVDRCPLPPATEGSQSDQRARPADRVPHDPAPPRRPHAPRPRTALLHRYGYLVGAATTGHRPVGRHGLRDRARPRPAGRPRRLRRHRPTATAIPHRLPPLDDRPGPGPVDGPTPLDPDLDEDPASWAPPEPLIPSDPGPVTNLPDHGCC